MSGNARPKWLAAIIGDDDADAALKGLEAATRKLDKAGIQRKDIDIEALKTQIVTALKEAKDGDNIEDIVRDELLDALQADDDSAREPVAESEEDAEDAEGDEEDVDAEGVIKALQTYAESTTKDMGEIGKAQLKQNERLNEHDEVLKAIAKKLDAIEKAVKGRPRQASKADETVIDEGNADDDIIAQVKKQLQVGMNGGGKTFMGLAVTEDPE